LVTTDDTGFAQFTIDYAKQFALWVNVTLTATAGVSGTESSSTVNFWLPASVEDMSAEDSPPSYRSPFGATSACNEVRETIPYNVSATADTAVVVYWRPVDQASNYNVYRFPGGGSCGGSLTAADLGGATKIASNLSTEFYVDSSALTGSSYCYAITANFVSGILDAADTRNVSATEGPPSDATQVVVAP
jgi:hypothetical protein